jgi:hypothetical protein
MSNHCFQGSLHFDLSIKPEQSLFRPEPALVTTSNVESSTKNHPNPLPMPEYGGWFAPLTEFLPNVNQAVVTFHRCNLALVLLTDLVVDGLDLECHSVDWNVHVPLMLHIIFLGLDNGREIVYRYAARAP